jgi:hypothetical protein
MQTTPLTIEQKNWLRTNTFLPVIMLAVMLLIIIGIFACIFTGMAGNPIFIGFAVLVGILIMAVLVATGLHIYNNAMDLKDGVAQVRTAKLMRKHETSRAPRTFYAEFQDIGDVIIMYDIYEKLEIGNLYQVTYSPRTKRGWSVEPR